MLALIAAQEAASIASGHGSPLTAPIGTGTVDGFAAGMLLSGVVFLLILAQRRALRRPTGANTGTAGPGTSAASAGQPHAGQAHVGRAHTEQAHAGQALAQDPALGVYPAPALAAPLLAAPVEADLPAPLGDLPAPLADLPASLADPFLTASFEVPEVGEQFGPALSTHPYADVSPFAGVSAPARFMPFADAANEVVLQPGVRLEEWLEGEMRRPSLPKRTPASVPSSASAPAPASAFQAAPAATAFTTAAFTTAAPATTESATTESATTESATAEPVNTVLAANVPAAVAAAEAETAVVPVTPAAPPVAPRSSENSADPDLADESGHHRKAPAYQSKHRLVGRNDSKPWPDNHRRGARHAAASPTRTRARSRMFGLRQLRPVSAGD